MSGKTGSDHHQPLKNVHFHITYVIKSHLLEQASIKEFTNGPMASSGVASSREQALKYELQQTLFRPTLFKTMLNWFIFWWVIQLREVGVEFPHQYIRIRRVQLFH